MKIIDLHCDTLMKSYVMGRDDIWELSGAMLDVRRMEKAGYMAQVFAVFMPPEDTQKELSAENPFSDQAYIESCFKTFRNTLALHSGTIAPVLSADDLKSNERAGKMSAITAFEDGRPIDGKIENLEKYYREGIRLITLTWNFENCFGYPNSEDPSIMTKGLKPFGKEAVERMNELGIVVDVSHLSDGGFRDVASISKKPFVASHSNCRALSPHCRNLTDDMIRALADSGGVAGLNFAPQFLNRDIQSKESSAVLISAHASHLVNAGGAECVALGSDLDGIEGVIETDSADKMNLLTAQFERDGFSGELIEKITWKNALRVLGENLRKTNNS